MNISNLFKQRLLFAILILYFLLGYFGCGYINMVRTHYFNVGFPFESSIPFIPFFIVGYTSVYIALIITYAVIDDYAVFKKAFIFFIVMASIHFLLFLLVPVKITRPDVHDAQGVMNHLTYYYYLIDNPVNCFPSLHVSFPLAATIALWDYKRNWAYLILAFTIFIAFSVIFVKQHYIMDVLAGAIITTSTFFLLKRCSKL